MLRRSLNLFFLIGLQSSIFFFTPFLHADIDRSVSTVFIEDNHNQPLAVSSISMEFFTEIYNKIANNESIPFRYPDDGCYARAHKVAMILDEIDVVSVKSFLVGNLQFITPDSPTGMVEWWYHVAAAVHIKSFNELYVIDPTASETPLSKMEWMSSLVQHQFGSIDETFETVRFIYGPEDAYQKVRIHDYKKADIFDMAQALEHFLDLLEQRTYGRRNLYVS